MEKELAGLEHFDKSRESMRKTLDLLHDRASSVLRFALQWNDVEEHFGSAGKSIEQRAKEVEAMGESVSRRLREVEAREKKLGSLHESINRKLSVLEKKEMEFAKLSEHLDTVQRCVDEKLKELGMKAKVLVSVKKAIDDRFNKLKVAETMEESAKQRPSEVEAREQELGMLKESNNVKSIELEKGGELDLIQTMKAFIWEWILEIQNKESLLSLLEVKEKELGSSHESKVKYKRRELELKEMKLHEWIEELELRERKLEERSKKLELGKRRSDDSPNPPAKMRKPFGKSNELSVGCESDGEKPLRSSKIEEVNNESEANEPCLSFDPEFNDIRSGNSVVICPNKGETWALYRDWDKGWLSDPTKHKPPYKYDYVEVISDLDDDFGVGVAYLGKVEGFGSVYERAEQHGIAAMQIEPGEMRRFSHRVPSFRMTEKEKEGVPRGSFELDPRTNIAAEDTDRESND